MCFGCWFILLGAEFCYKRADNNQPDGEIPAKLATFLIIYTIFTINMLRKH